MRAASISDLNGFCNFLCDEVLKSDKMSLKVGEIEHGEFAKYEDEADGSYPNDSRPLKEW